MDRRYTVIFTLPITRWYLVVGRRVTDVDPPAGLQPLWAYKIVAGYQQFVSDQDGLAALRKKFDSYTGPVVNKGGVR